MWKSLYVVLAEKKDRNEIMLKKFSSIFRLEFSLIAYSSTFSVERWRAVGKNSEEFRVRIRNLIRGFGYFIRKREKRVFYVQDLISHREIRTIYLTTTYPRFQRGGEGDRFGSCSIVSWPGNWLRHVSWNTFSRLHWNQVESVLSRKTKNAIYPSKTRGSCSRFGTKYFNAIASNHTWR